MPITLYKSEVAMPVEEGENEDRDDEGSDEEPEVVEEGDALTNAVAADEARFSGDGLAVVTV